MEWCASAGISVAVAAGSNARGVLQWIAAALGWLATHPSVKSDCNEIVRNISAYRGLKPPEFPSAMTLGVVGVGHVGGLVRAYAAGWGFRVICSDPPRERAEGLGAKEGFYPLETLTRECDILTLHTPLTTEGPDATVGLVGRELVRTMKPAAVIINSSRGAVVDESALVERDYILDVWNHEPDIDRAVLERALLATPHIAGYSVQGKATATAAVVRALARRFGFNELRDWFPTGVPRSEPRAISWEEMLYTMPSRFDIAAQSRALKAAPEKFEELRNTYKYRTEYF
jgi:erythronate-4-phosphate dehydrogenase